MTRRQLPLFVFSILLAGACSSGSQPLQGSQPQTAPSSTDEPAPGPAADPAADKTPEPAGARLVEPLRMRGDVEQPQATLFENREALDAGTFATAVMGETYTEPDFGKEHIVGIVLPPAPSGTKFIVESATFDAGVITVTCTVERAEAADDQFTIQPSYVIAIPKHDGARSIVVKIDGEGIADLAIPEG